MTTWTLPDRLEQKVLRLRGEIVPQTILEYARENRIGKIVVGKTWHPWFKRLLKDDIMDHILRRWYSIDVYVVTFENPKKLHLRS